MKKRRNNYHRVIVLVCIMTLGVTLLPFSAYADYAEIRKTWIDDDVVRYEYLDQNGNRVPGERGFAMYECVLNDARKRILTTYYNADGTPFYGGEAYCSIGKEYDARNNVTKIIYMDIDKNWVISEKGYAALGYVLDEDNHILEEHFYDVNNHPMQRPAGYYSTKRTDFDSEGRAQYVTYVDQNGEPVVTQSGYAAIARKFDANGNIVERFFYGIDGQPMQLWLGEYGQRIQYDEQGREIIVTYLGENRQPKAVADGYTAVRKEYKENNLYQKLYLDEEENPYVTSRGQSGVRFDWDNGKQTEIPIDQNGNELFFLDNFLLRHPAIVLFLAVLLVLMAWFAPRKSQYLLLAGYVVFVLYMTLLTRERNENARVILNLAEEVQQALHSADKRLHIAYNVLLFVPFGFLLCRIWPKARMCFVSILFTIIIEVIQLVTRFGWFEAADIAANSLGGILGSLAALLLSFAQREITAKKRTKGQI